MDIFGNDFGQLVLQSLSEKSTEWYCQQFFQHTYANSVKMSHFVLSTPDPTYEYFSPDC